MNIKSFDQYNESLKDKMTGKMSEEEANELIIPLDSVGAGIDKKGNVYIAMKDGGYEYNGTNYIDEIDNNEWWETLSPKDKEIISNIKNNLKI